MVVLWYTFHSMSLRWYGLDVVILIIPNGHGPCYFVTIILIFQSSQAPYAPAKFCNLNVYIKYGAVILSEVTKAFIS